MRLRTIAATKATTKATAKATANAALILAVLTTWAGGAASGCSNDKGAAAPDGGATAGTLYARLGGEPGVTTVMHDFVARVAGDAKINGYFLNGGVDTARLTNCLVLQVGKLAGGPQAYPSAGCRDMKAAHAGLKISQHDFDDLAGHLVAALQNAGVAAADVQTVVDAVAPMSADIVEDATSTGTVYQRVGRKPAIQVVIANFVTRVLADARINGFFGGAHADRLNTCLVRQVCGVDGPCKYGQEVDGEPGVTRASPCHDMVVTHIDVASPAGSGAAGKAITKADFDALVEDLLMELDAAGVAAADKAALAGALGPLCKDIVKGGEGC